LVSPHQRQHPARRWITCRAERSGQNLGAIPCAVGEKNARCTLRDKTVEDGPRCTACAKHHYWSPPLVPVRGLLVEVGHEAVSVGIAGVQPSRAVEPERIGGADRPRRFVGYGREPQRLRFMRQGHVGPGIAAVAKRAEEARELLRPHSFFLVGAIDAIEFEPVTMDRR